MLIIFFDIKRILHKEFVLASQTVNSAYYCAVLHNCMKMCGPNFGDKRTGCCIMTTHCLTLLFTRQLLTENNKAVVPHPPYFLFPRLKIKLKGCHFDTTGAIEAESQAVLNTLREHDLQDAFRKWQKCWERCICAEVDFFGGDGCQ
jgi:hypothetical protein